MIFGGAGHAARWSVDAKFSFKITISFKPGLVLKPQMTKHVYNGVCSIDQVIQNIFCYALECSVALW